jgi:hypothetical protein
LSVSLQVQQLLIEAKPSVSPRDLVAIVDHHCGADKKADRLEVWTRHICAATNGGTVSEARETLYHKKEKNKWASSRRTKQNYEVHGKDRRAVDVVFGALFVVLTMTPEVGR